MLSEKPFVQRGLDTWGVYHGSRPSSQEKVCKYPELSVTSSAGDSSQSFYTACHKDSSDWIPMKQGV
jgi:hypothetical protein